MAENRYKQAKKVFSISLGCRGWVFKSPHSDRTSSEIVDFRGGSYSLITAAQEVKFVFFFFPIIWYNLYCQYEQSDQTSFGS